MRITLDLTPAAVAAAERTINDRFNLLAQDTLQRDAEHKAKRDVANGVLQRGEQPPAAFAAEAALKDMSVEAFAEMVAGKPDDVLERGFMRRQLIEAVRAAGSPAAVRAVMLRAGFPPNYDAPHLPQPV